MKQVVVKILFTGLIGVLGFAGAQPDFSWPITGCVNSRIGPRNGSIHKGLDVAKPIGTPVYAMASGVVKTASPTSGPAGNLVEVQHEGPYLTRYLHLNSISVSQGANISQGTQVGTVGSSGRSTGPHLHVEVIRGTEWTDPYVNINGALPPDGCITANEDLGDISDYPSAGNGDLSAEIDYDNLLSYLLPRPVLWLTRANNVLSGKREDGTEADELIDLYKVVRDLAWVLMFSLFVYGLIHATYFFRSGDYMSLFMRLGVASMIILGSPSINTVLKNVWSQAYETSEEVFARSIDQKLGTAVAVLSAESFGAAVAIYGKEYLEDITAGRSKPSFALPKVQNVNEAGKSIAGKFLKLLGAALFMILVLYIVYGIGLYISALTVLLVMLMLPVVAALLLRQEFTKFFLHSVGIYASALVAIAVGPAVFTILMDLAFVVPVEQLAQSVDNVGQNLGSFDVVQATGQLVVQFFLTIILTAVGLLLAFWLLLDFEKMIANFLGGVSGAGSAAVENKGQSIGRDMAR